MNIKGRYGAVRITKALHEAGIFTKEPSLSRPNLINQIFKATAPNKVWLGDMSYIPTKEGMLCLAVNIDVFFT